MEKTLLRIQNLQKIYPVKKKLFKKKKNYVHAINNITCDIIETETLGIVGESGSGKSTLGKTIVGLEQVTAGEIYFRNKRISELKQSELQPLKREIQMIFQDPYASLDPKQRIGKCIEEPLLIHSNLCKEERYETVIKLLSEVGLNEDSYHRYPHEFSGGQRQRIAIARVLTINPTFIVCDEPVSALDVSVQAQIISLLRSLQKKHGLTYLFISHSLGVVRHVCDRVMVMYLGHGMELAPVKELYRNPLHPYTQTLLAAVPRLHSDAKKERFTVRSNSLDGTVISGGCVFYNRCRIAENKCQWQVPKWREVKENHFVACHAQK